MGDRYFVTVICGACGRREEDVYYAPTCGFVSWKCPQCGSTTDLEECTGITYEDASNLGAIREVLAAMEGVR